MVISSGLGLYQYSVVGGAMLLHGPVLVQPVLV